MNHAVHPCPKCRFINPGDTNYCGKCGTALPPPPESAVSVTETLNVPQREAARGTVFADRYEIIEELGRGGMGVVYRAEDKKINEDVALKLIDPQISSDRKAIARFGEELKIARKISHRNVCRMHDLGESGGTHFITMEYVAGEDLKNLIKRIGRLPLEKALAVAGQVADGLAEAHRLDIIHRDLKPGNIMIDREGNAKIMDFGIARSLKRKSQTGTGFILGTPDYMSPEQAEGKDLDRRSDIYSLGVILYEMVTGRVPFEGETPLSVAMKHKGERPRDPKEWNPQIPAPLSRLILRCLEKEKEKRFQTAAELRAEIAVLERGHPSTDKEKSKKKPSTSKQITVTFRPEKLILPALAAAAIVAIGFVIWSMASRGRAAERSIAVISFQNLTGDKAYDYLQVAIPNLLISSLEQSKDFRVTTFERLHDLLKQTGREQAEAIDIETGFDLCQRENVEALALGSFIKMGQTFAADVKVYDVGTRRLLTSATARGEGVQSILDKQIGQLSRDISRGVGLSAKSVEATPLNGADFTTSSLEAYKNFIIGRDFLDKFYREDAVKYLEKAIGLDPQFATAYLYLYRAYRYQLKYPKSIEALKKAKQFSARATRKERLYIEAAYAKRVEKDADREFRLLQEIAAAFPKEKEAHSTLSLIYQEKELFPEAMAEANKALELDPAWTTVLNQLGYLFIGMGDFAKAETYFKKAVAVAPGDANPLDSLGQLYLLKGRLDEAIAQYQEAIRVKPDFGSEDIIAYIYAVKGDYAQALNWLDQFILAAPSKSTQTLGYCWKAIYNHLLGRRNQAGLEMARVRKAWQSMNDKYGSALAALVQAYLDFDRGEYDSAGARFREYESEMAEGHPQSASIRPVEKAYWTGLLDWRQGRLDAAQEKIDTVRPLLAPNKGPAGLQLKKNIHILQAEIWLSRGQAAKVGPFFEKEFRLDIPIIPTDYFRIYIWYIFPLAQDVLARAYQEVGDIDRAIKEYRKLVVFDPASQDRRPRNPIYLYRLARVLEQQGLKAEAENAYAGFVGLWKDADPEIPELKDARKRLGRN